jgi:predicted small secreted protein
MGAAPDAAPGGRRDREGMTMRMDRLRLLVLPALLLALAACNTVSGAGRDVQAVGRGLTGIADDVKRRLD